MAVKLADSRSGRGSRHESSQDPLSGQKCAVLQLAMDEYLHQPCACDTAVYYRLWQ